MVPINKMPAEDIVKIIVESDNKLQETIKTVFTKFDKDNSGFIELDEIKSIAKELGLEMTPEEASAYLKDLDTNQDGKISYDEFVQWWLSGRPGKLEKMEKLMVKFLGVHFKDALDMFKMIEKPFLVEGSFGIYVNKVKEPGLGIHFDTIGSGEELKAEYAQYAEGLGLDPEMPFIGIAFGSKNPSEAKATLQSLFENSLEMVKAMVKPAKKVLPMIDFKFGNTDKKTLLTIIPSEEMTPMISGVKSKMPPNLKSLVEGQFIRFALTFATDLKQIISADKPAYECILDGISFDMKSKTMAEVSKMIGKAISNMKFIPRKQRKLIPTFFAQDSWVGKTKGELEFEVDDNLKAKIKEMAGATPFAMPLKDLKPMMAAQAKEMISAIPIAEMVYNFFKDEVSFIEVFFYGAGVGGHKIRIDLPGLGDFINLDQSLIDHHN
eukprot:TRINITY_DN1372_c0_g1_i3.p1 TRINITY_DN1372_c0_g1~~TRINITY_DN1372_c0_g1_i3.p1  ORF type:complete len:437 (-),score=89.71 TRINITY_DN1372_c0_g1_i3:35-1345(-)